MRRTHFLLAALALLCAACGKTSAPAGPETGGDSILAIREQGSFMIGGDVVTAPGTYDTRQPLKPDGQTLHGDHAYVSYQIPDRPRKFPLVFLHGAGQSAKTWETTPDGREGFATLFLRRSFSVYLVDQPRRGRAGRSTVSEQITATPDDQFWFENFRMGVWPDFYEGSQFPQSPAALEQFFRQMTPNTGAYDEGLIAGNVAALMDKVGGGILVTHSQGGGPGWHAAIRSASVRAIVSYESGSGFVFPEGEVPEPLETISPFGPLAAAAVPPADFEKLTRIPIVIYYGDYIPAKPDKNWAKDSWRVRLQMARLFADCINRHGGDATVVHLPELGIRGNSHFLFAERNNRQLAACLPTGSRKKAWTERRARPHRPPWGKSSPGIFLSASGSHGGRKRVSVILVYQSVIRVWPCAALRRTFASGGRRSGCAPVTPKPSESQTSNCNTGNENEAYPSCDADTARVGLQRPAI